MNSIKLVGLALMMALATSLNAQNSKAVDASAKATVQQISEVVNLTDDQQTLIYRQLLTYEGHVSKAKSQKSDEANSKLAKSEEMMMENIEKIVGEEEFKKVKPLLMKKEKAKNAKEATGNSSLKSNN